MWTLGGFSKESIWRINIRVNQYTLGNRRMKTFFFWILPCCRIPMLSSPCFSVYNLTLEFQWLGSYLIFCLSSKQKLYYGVTSFYNVLPMDCNVPLTLSLLVKFVLPSDNIPDAHFLSWLWELAFLGSLLYCFLYQHTVEVCMERVHCERWSCS